MRTYAPRRCGFATFWVTIGMFWRGRRLTWGVSPESLNASFPVLASTVVYLVMLAQHMG